MNRRKREFEDFFRKEHKKLKKYVDKSIRDDDYMDSEDIIQEVMANIYDGYNLTVPIENLAAYIYRAIKNKIIDLYRKNKNRPEESINSVDAYTGFSLSDALHDPRDEIVYEIERGYVENRLYEAIDMLEPDERELIILTEFESKTFRELSEEWGIPIGTLLSKKSRALKKVKNILNDLF